jgi:hypothetical protein
VWGLQTDGLPAARLAYTTPSGCRA